MKAAREETSARTDMFYRRPLFSIKRQGVLEFFERLKMNLL